MSTRRNSRFESYAALLKALSARTGTPLSSLLVSFGVLHEITALVPLVGVFYGARALGVGEVVINTIAQTTDPLPGVHENNWFRGTLRRWVVEGDEWAGRIGRRYGVLGFEKRTSESAPDAAEPAPVSSRIAGDVANSVLAYSVTKASTVLELLLHAIWD
jgi:hypothetical protein